MCGGSPLIRFVVVLMIAVFNLQSGRIHRRGDILCTLVLPSVCIWLLQFILGYLHVGEITQGSLRNSTLVLPSLNRKNCCGLCSI